jgi:hypothetical protein
MQAIDRDATEDALCARDALPAHQLRRGGYLLGRSSPSTVQVRSAGGIAPRESTLRDWRAR